MKYNQPYGISDPNAAYINGNPTTGIMGSIPPAASIEFPQRELVQLITDAGLTPDNADLTQLVKAMKRVDVFNVFKAAVNGGNASQWSAAVPSLPTMPPPTGTQIWFKPNYDSVMGGTVFSVNGSAFLPVTHPDLQKVTQGDVHASAWLLLFFDGLHWQIIAGSSRVIGALPLLQRNTSWYVDAALGNDTTYDGTSPTVMSATVGPFRTIGRASNEILLYNMNNYNQYIYIANGTYPEQCNFREINGTGQIFVIGNPTSPQSVVIAPAGAGSLAIMQSGGIYNYNGLRLTTPSNGLDGFAIAGGWAYPRNLWFGPCGRFHVGVQQTGYCQMWAAPGENFTIEAGATAQAHLNASSGGFLTIPAPIPSQWPTINILGPVNLNNFAFSDHAAILQMLYKPGGIVGAAYVTGLKYSANANAIVDAFGSGVNYFPGTLPGQLSTGGQYV